MSLVSTTFVELKLVYFNTFAPLGSSDLSLF